MKMRSRVVHERAREHQAALHAARERLDLGIGAPVEAGELEQRRDARADLRVASCRSSGRTRAGSRATVKSGSRLSICGTTPTRRARLARRAGTGGRAARSRRRPGRSAPGTAAASWSCPRRSARAARSTRRARLARSMPATTSASPYACAARALTAPDLRLAAQASMLGARRCRAAGAACGGRMLARPAPRPPAPLRPRPVEHGRERHGLVELAVDHQRVGRTPVGRPQRGVDRRTPTSTSRSALRAAARRASARRRRTRSRRARRQLAVAGSRPSAATRTQVVGLAVARRRACPRSRRRRGSSAAPRRSRARRTLRASVCTTLLSRVPPNSGCGCAISAMPRAGLLPLRLRSANTDGWSTAHLDPARRRRVDREPVRASASQSAGRSTMRPFDEVLLDDLVDVRLVDVGVPDRLGVDDDARAFLAAVEAARLVDADLAGPGRASVP